MTNIRSYVEVIKPRMVFLLVFTSIASMIISTRINATYLTEGLWLLAIVAITAGCSGCNAITCYLDRDIDAVMKRTQNRPLPSGKINPAQNALYFGLALIFISVSISLTRNVFSFVIMTLGIFDNVVIYSILLKRKNPTNIILGGISGGLPALFGWVYVANNINLAPVLLASLVIVWTPNHIWSLALRYKEDYKKAKVPMFPVVVEEEKAVRYIVLTSVLLMILSVWIHFLGIFGIVYLTTISILGSVVLLTNFWLFFRQTSRKALIVFKISSPYLALVFIAMILDTFLMY